MNATVIVRIGSRSSFKEWVDPMCPPSGWPMSIGEYASDENGKWDGYVGSNGFKKVGRKKVRACGFVIVQFFKGFGSPAGADGHKVVRQLARAWFRSWLSVIWFRRKFRLCDEGVRK